MNIFDNRMAMFELIQGISKKITDDWKEEDLDSDVGLYDWIENTLPKKIEEEVKRRLAR